MNSQLHRVVFNRTRGDYMVVQETAASASGRTGQTHRRRAARPAALAAALHAVACAAALAFGLMAPAAGVLAQTLPLTPHAGAPAGQRPLMDAAANGVPIVHIAPPSAAGISRNLYTDFNVERRGLILNNAAGSSQTQIGGWVAGNPQLGYVPAKVIVNEVLGTQRSQLLGAIEVAGRKADLVIANPNGLVVDGLGFINTDRAVISTGVPQFGAQGALQGITIRTGLIEVGAQGLDATSLEQLDLFARGLSIGGEVWARRLHVVAGANDIGYAGLGQAPDAMPASAADGSAAPMFAVDVKHLGAMYAGQIFLLATERGLGVNSTGRLAALQGNLTLSVDGQLSLADSHGALGVNLASTGDMVLGGTVSTAMPVDGSRPGDMVLNSRGVLRQAGTLDAAGSLSLQAAELHHSGSTVQRDILGTLSLTVAGAAHTSGLLHSSGLLNMVAGHLHDTSGRWQAQRSLRIEAGDLQLDGSELNAAADALLVARDGELVSMAVQVVAQGPLNVVAAGRWTNLAGAWQAHAGITARAADMRNEGGTVITSGQLDLAAARQLDNSEGQLIGAAGVSIRAGLLRNDGTAGRPSEISSDADMRLLLGGAMSNRAGLVSAKRSVDVVLTEGLFDNSGGALLSDGTLSLQAASVVNRGGQIVSTLKGDAAAAAGIATGLRLQGGSLDNSHGLVSSASDMTVLAQQGLINTQGLIEGAGAVSVDAATGRLNNAGGTIAATQALQLNAAELLNERDAEGRSAVLLAGTDLLATAGRISNQGSSMTAQHSLQLRSSQQGLSNLDGTLAAGGPLTLRANQIDNQRGSILSNEAVSLTASGLGNQAGRISAPQLRIALGQGLLDNEQGSLIADGGLAPAESRSLWLTQGQVNNRGGVIATSGALSLDTQGRDLDNAGGLVRAAGSLEIAVAALINNGGLIDGRSDVRVNAVQLQGAGGSLQAGIDGDVTVQGELRLDGGSLQAGRDLRVQGASLRQSKSGLVAAGRDLMVSAGHLDNQGADIVGGGSVTLAGLEAQGGAALVLVNDAGRIESAATLRLDTGSLSNLGGTITAAGPNDVVSRGVVANAGGEISSASTLKLDTNGAALDNRAGRLIADQALQLAAGTVDNAQGAIASTRGQLDLRGTTVSNIAGVVSAGQAIDLGVAEALVNRGGSIGAGGDLRVDAGAGGVDNTSGRIHAGAGREDGTGSLVIDTRGLLLNVDTGSIVADTDARIQAGSIRSSGVVSASGRAHLTAGDLDNSGLLQAVGPLTVALAGALDNQGLLQSGKDLGVSAATLRNHRPQPAAPAGDATFAHGLIASGGAMELGIRGELLNEGAEIAAQATLTLRADAVRNEAGRIGANGPLSVSTGHAMVNTQRADLQSLADVRIEAGRVENSGASRVLAGGALRLQASGEWVNDQSTLASVEALSARGTAISNRAGEIVGQGGVDLGAGRLDNTAGRIAAGRSGDVPLLADLRIDTGGQALANDGGVLRAMGDVRLLAGPLTNRGGHVLAGRALQIDASATDNHAGVLMATGAVTLRSGALRNEGGDIHAEHLLIDTLGLAPAQAGAAVLDNTRGRIVGSAALNLSAGELINVQGLVTSQGRTVLRTGVFTNDDGALAALALDLHATGQLVNAGGLIQSGGDLTLRAQGLSNSRSTTRQSSEAGRTPGLIKAAADADIVIGHAATNHGGQILAGGTLQLQAERLSNDAGVLQAEGAADARLILAVRDAISNQAGGLMQAQHGLQLQTGVFNNAGGSVASPGSATLAVGSWINGDGALQAADVNFIASGIVANAGGSIGASRDLTLTAQSLYSTVSDLGVQSQVLAGRDLTLMVADQLTTVQTLVRGDRVAKIEAAGLANDEGQIESMGGLDLTVHGALSNRAGIIRTTAPSSTLAIRAGSVDNTGGLLDAATDLDIHTGQLINTGGRMQARGASFVLNAGHASNLGGAMVSAGHLRATTLSFDNSGGSLSASQALHLDTQAHALTNRAMAGGSATIVAGGEALLSVATLDNLQDAGAQATVAAQALSLRAASLNNTGSILAGSIGRDGSLDLQTAGTVDNDGGLLSAFGQLSIGAGELLNRGGTLLAASGNGSSRPSLVLSAARVDNSAGGRISALHGNASINTGTGDYLNRAGITSAAGDLDVLAGLLDNSASATLQAGGALHATTMALHNGDGGWVHGNGVTLDTRGWTLHNASGALSSSGGLTVVAGGLDNRGGSAAALGQLALTIGGTVDNTRGMLSGEQSLQIDAAQQVVNTGGTVKSAAGSVAVAAARIDNDGGTLLAAHGMTLAATQSISNRAAVLNGSSVAGRIAGRDLDIFSPWVDNHGGTIAADRDAVLRTQAVDNTGGNISARRNLSLSAPTLINAGGTITADALLALSTASGNPGGTISGTSLSMDLDGDYANEGTLSARQDLTLRARSIVNTGVLSAAGNLRAQAAGAITNTGEMSGGNVVLDAGAHLSNYGLISSAAAGGHARLSAAVMANTGRIYGDLIALQAGSVSNSVAGAIAARQRLDIGAGSIVNTGADALLYSLGGMGVGGALDTGTWQSTDRAQTLSNTAGRIEAAGDMALRADVILNANSGVSTVMGPVTAGPASAYLVPDGSTQRYDLAQCSGVENRSMYATCIVRPELYGRRQNVLPIFSLSNNCDYGEAGGDCFDVITWNYPWDSDAYERFGITRMDRPRPAEPSSGCTVSHETESAGLSVSDVHSPECNHWRTLTQAWDADHHVRRDQLGAALNAYNAEVDYENEVDSIASYTVFRLTSTIQREQTVNSEPGRILSGGSMTIEGVDITNRDSRIVAGGDLMVNGLSDDDGVRSAISNVATQGQQITTYAGTSQHSNLTDGGLGSGRRRRLDPEQPFNPAPSVTTVDAETSVVVRHAAALQGGVTTASGAGYDGATASGAGSVVGQPLDPRAGPGPLPAGAARPGAAPVGAEASRIGATHVPAWSSIESLSNDGADEAQERPAPPAEGSVQMAQSRPVPLLQRQQAWTVSRMDRPAAIVSQRVSAIRQGVPPGASAASARPGANAQVPVALRYEVRDSSARTQAVILTLAPRLSAPGSSLFVLKSSPAVGYLVETDPAFTNYRRFVSSEYFLQQMALDPQRQHKRYGDGFSEQQLVNDQILALTGRRYLSDYGDTESEYLSLMNAGAAFGQRYQLTPGVTLTGEQMALLSTDIVWLVEQDVRLPDGSTQRVLVPQVYLRRPISGDLLPTGTLMAGGSVSVVTPGSLSNSGTLSGDWIKTSAGSDLDNTGRIQATQSVLLSAQRDLVNTSGSVAALAGSVDLAAGRDVVLRTRTVETNQIAANRHGAVQSTRVAADRIATIQAGQDLLLSAGRDIDVAGASLQSAEGDLQGLAGRNITVSALQGEYRLESHATKGRSVRGRTGFVEEGQTTQVASEFDAGGNLVLLAGRDPGQAAGPGGRLQLSGSTLAAQGDVRLQGDQVSIAAATASESTDIQAVGRRAYDRASTRSESLVGGSVAAQGSLLVRATGQPDQGQGDVHLAGAHLSAQQGATVIDANRDIRIESISTTQNSFTEGYRKSTSLLSSTTRTRTSRDDTSRVEGSVIEGQLVLVRAGQDVFVQGSQVVADQALRFEAGRDLKVVAAHEHSEGQAASSRTKSGIFGTGGGLTAGRQQLQQGSRYEVTRQVGSQLGSLSGDVMLVAGRMYEQSGSDVVSPSGDIDIQAQQVLIQEARETTAQSAESRFRQSGVSFTVSSPVLSALQAAQGQLQSASNTRSSRLQALAGANAALQVNAALDALVAGQGDAQGQVATNQDNPDGSPVRVDGNAADKVGGINVSLIVGGSSSRSQQQSQADSSRGSTVVAGGNVRIQATGGGADSDVVIQGSDVVAGGRVAITADDAVRLLASQNTSSERSSNSSRSGSIGVGMSLGNAGNGSSVGLTFSASVSRGQGAGNSTTYDNSRVVGSSVHIESGGNTELRGAVVRGDQMSAQVGGDLIIESLQDQERYRERSRSAGGSVTFGPTPGGSAQIGATSIRSDFLSVTEQSALRAGDGGFQVQVAGKTELTGGQITSTQAAIEAGKNRYEALGGTSTTDLQNSASYSANSASVSIVTGGGSSGNRSGAGVGGAGFGTDADSARSESKAAISGVAGDGDARTGDREVGLAQLFDKERVKAEVAAQVAITAEFSRQASTMVGNFAQQKMKLAESKLDEALAAAAAGDSQAAADLRAEARQIEADWGDQGKLRLAAHTIIGGLTGGAAGAAGAAVGTLTAPKVANALKEAGLDTTLVNGITALASTAAGAVVGGTAGAATSFNEVKNNYLNHQQWSEFARRLQDCRTESECEQVRKAYFDLSKEQDAALREACQDINSVACRTHIREALKGTQTQLDLALDDELPSRYVGGSDLNANANLIARNVLSSDIKRICAGSTTCQEKSEAALKKIGSVLLDFTPIIGDIKGFVEAETPFDYLLATVGVVGGPLSDGVKAALKEGAALYKAGKVEDAAQLLRQTLSMSATPGLAAVRPSLSGYLSKTKLGEAATLTTDTFAQRLMISDVVANGDRFGYKTEALVNDVISVDPSLVVLSGTKYSGEKGLDHVVQFVDPVDGLTKTMVIDSKQAARNGSTSLNPQAAGSAELQRSLMQLSDTSLRTVVKKLNGTPAGNAVEAALDNRTLVKGIAYVDKVTGELKTVKVHVP